MALANMTSNVFHRLGASGRGTRSFYEQLRARDDDVDVENNAGLSVDDENLTRSMDGFDPDGLAGADSRLTVDSVAFDRRTQTIKPPGGKLGSPSSKWPSQDEELDNDVPASLLVEPNNPEPQPTTIPLPAPQYTRRPRQQPGANAVPGSSNRAWEPVNARPELHEQTQHQLGTGRPRSLMAGTVPGGSREKALWRWVNTSNLDSFMRDVYDYYEGGGIWCILVSNALWLLYDGPSYCDLRRRLLTISSK